MNIRLLSLLLTLAFPLNAFSESPGEVDPMPQEAALEILRVRTLELDAPHREAMADFAMALPESTRNQLATDWADAAEKQIALPDLFFIADAPGSRPLFGPLADHTDPLIRLLALCQLTAGGDEQAAQQIHALFHDATLPEQDARIIRFYSNGIGLDASTETPKSIAAHLKIIFSQEPLLQPGDAAPLFNVQDMEANPLNLEAMRGRIVVLHFWATWCNPCIGEMPHLKKQLEPLDPESVVIIGVSLDRDRVALADAIEQFDMPWYNVFDSRGWGTELTRAYGINSVPTTVIIDRQGLVHSDKIEDIDQLLADGDSSSH